MTSELFDPPERGRAQPYTMCHTLRLVDPHMPDQGCHVLGTPALGTSHSMEFPEVPIRLCLTAPVAVQRAAREAGMSGVMRIRIPGLAEALERDKVRRRFAGKDVSPAALDEIVRLETGRHRA